jgi:hypothetical protein
MKYIAIIAVITIIILLACSKGVVDPTYFNEVFRGITYTDRGGIIIGPVDSSDWQISDAPLNSLYRISSKSIGKFIPPTGCGAMPAFPNPTEGLVTVYLYTPVPCNWEVDIINESYNVVAHFAYYTEAGTVSIYWDLKDLDGHSVLPGMYRVIYQFYYGTDFDEIHSYSGYGDIWVIDKNAVIPMKK